MFLALDSTARLDLLQTHFLCDRSRAGEIALQAARGRHAQPVARKFFAVEGAGLSLKNVKLHNLYEFVIV